jgi:Transglycosylase SLT domain
MRASGSMRAVLAVPLAAVAALICLVASIAVLFGGQASGCASTTGGVSDKVPQWLAPIYGQASARYGLGSRGPAILASINFHETDFGRDLGTSSAGAEGWMQFEPSSWTAYGVDANGDERKDPNSPADAIFAAARLLRAAGAPGDWRGAIFTYNHAGWYVAEVLADARRFAGASASGAVEACVAVAPSGALGRMLGEAERLDRLHLVYVWGGSHGQSPTPPNGPFDCSSAVSHLLQVGGFGNPTMDTIGLSSLGRLRSRPWADHLRQALRPRGPHLHRIRPWPHATRAPLLGHVSDQPRRRPRLDPAKCLLFRLSRRLRTTSSAGSMSDPGRGFSQQAICDPG